MDTKAIAERVEAREMKAKQALQEDMYYVRLFLTDYVEGKAGVDIGHWEIPSSRQKGTVYYNRKLRKIVGIQVSKGDKSLTQSAEGLIEYMMETEARGRGKMASEKAIAGRVARSMMAGYKTTQKVKLDKYTFNLESTKRYHEGPVEYFSLEGKHKDVISLIVDHADFVIDIEVEFYGGEFFDKSIMDKIIRAAKKHWGFKVKKVKRKT